MLPAGAMHYAWADACNGGLDGCGCAQVFEEPAAEEEPFEEAFSMEDEEGEEGGEETDEEGEEGAVRHRKLLLQH